MVLLLSLIIFILSSGEGQFGVVHQALAEGICSHDLSRKVVAVKTLKRMWDGVVCV